MPATLAALKPASNLDALQREVMYRLSYRGTLELDLICRAALPYVLELPEADLLILREMLLRKEGDLMAWLVDNHPAPPEWQTTVNQLRQWFAAWRLANKDALK